MLLHSLNRWAGDLVHDHGGSISSPSMGHAHAFAQTTEQDQED